MDGIILSDLYEEKYGIIQEDTILKFYGSVEVDDYRSRETNSTMYRMRVKNINAVESDLVDSKKDLLIICDTVSGCLLYTSPSPRDPKISRMPSSA